jgi:alginate O-acetyltransferase complex protein AlgI
MALGLGKMFGFKFPENFNFPYIAKSIQHFWRRWHITLSEWFKNYLYIPLGGNRCSSKRVLLNLYIVFFFTGLWHGASWNFVIWGLIHGTFITLERLGWSKLLAKSFGIVQHFYTIFVVLVAWVFFRIDNLSDAINYVKALFGCSQTAMPNIYIYRYFSLDFIIILTIALLGTTPFFEFINNQINIFASKCKVILHLKYILVAIGIVFLFFVIINQLVTGSYNPFIYFRF